MVELGEKLKNESNPKDALGLKKVPMDLVPATSVIYQALAMRDGARKYGPYNWRQNKVRADIYIAAAKRHLDSWHNGEEKTRDSNVPHLGCVLACIGILVDAIETGNLIDNRPTPAPIGDILERYEEVL